MSDSGKEQLRLKDRVEALCVEMIERGILFPEAMEQFEKFFISEVLRRCGGNLQRTAERLKIHRNTLAKRVGHYKIRPR